MNDVILITNWSEVAWNISRFNLRAAPAFHNNLNSKNINWSMKENNTQKLQFLHLQLITT